MSTNSDGSDYKTTITADARGYEAGWRAAVKAAETGSNAIQGHFDRINDMVGKAATVLAGFTLAAGAGLAIKALVEASAEMTESAMDMARALGTTTNQAAVLRATFEDVGASPEEFTGAAKGMAKQLRENEAAMNAMGLKTRDAAGQFRPLTDLVLDGIEVMNGYAEGADRTIAGMALFGKGMDAGSKLLLVNRDAVNENRQAVEDLGLTVGANAVAAWQAFDGASDRAALGVRGMVNTIGAQLMPVATDLVRLFNAAMPAAIVVARGALGGLTSAFLLVKTGIVVVWETLNAMVITVAEPVLALFDAMGMAMGGDLTGAAQRLAGIGPNISAAWGRAMQSMTETSVQTANTIGGLFTPDLVDGDSGGTKGTKSAKVKTEKAAEAPSRMGTWEAQLAQAKAAIERLGMEEGQYRQRSLADNLAFWQQLGEAKDLTDGERVAIARKTAEAEMALAKQSFEVQVANLQAEAAAHKDNVEERLRIERQIQAKYADGTKEYAAAQARIVAIEREAASQAAAIKLTRADATHQAALHQIDMEEQAAEQLLALGGISDEQFLVQEMAFEARRYAIQVEGLRARLLLAETDAVERERINLQLQGAQEEHEKKMAGIKGDLKNQGMQPLVNTFQAAESAIAASIEGMLNRTMTLKQGLQAAWKGISQSIVSEIAKILAKKVAGWAVERALTLAGVQADAVKAGSGAAASQASIPYVGPILAIAAMAAIMSQVSGAKSAVPTFSAAGGFDIPATLNPVVQAHAREMILPAKYADVIRQVGDAPTGDGGPLKVELAAHPMPGNYFMVHRDQLVKALNSARRDNAWK